MRLIDADALKDKFQLQNILNGIQGLDTEDFLSQILYIIRDIDKMPTWDGEKLIEMYKWERDIAISQLNELGYQLGEKIREEDKPSQKEIPIKPIEKYTGQNKYYSCPIRDEYCPNCGQKIDWND